MNWLEALFLGIIQGLTEFLPVSSSGHLEIAKHLLGLRETESLSFSIAVHGATTLSIIVVFWEDIKNLFKEFFAFKWNKETQYIFKILISMLPVGITGILFKEKIKVLFTGDVVFVGYMLIITAILLGFTFFAKPKNKNISFFHSFIIGISQAIAVIPGISRSGATISTGLLLGNKKEEIARFSFLMVVIPIIGENILDLINGEMTKGATVGNIPLLIGFLAAFISGFLACKWMLKIIKKGKLIYFAIYCLLIGLIIIIFK
jgi:undecaprenyl-diphosphatase